MTNEYRKPRLRAGHRGKAMWGTPGLEAMLPFRITAQGLSFRVKETWLRPKLGEFATITLEELQALIDEYMKE